MIKIKKIFAGILNAEKGNKRLNDPQKNNIDLSNVKGKGQKTLNSRRRKDCQGGELRHIQAPVNSFADPFLKVCLRDPPQEATDLFYDQAALGQISGSGNLFSKGSEFFR